MRKLQGPCTCSPCTRRRRRKPAKVKPGAPWVFASFEQIAQERAARLAECEFESTEDPATEPTIDAVDP